tara:strand:- start:348 stop:1130 length:783 start_codon:yes stop_codon:yes gene_type:complete
MNQEATKTASITKIDSKLPSATLFEDDANAGFQTMSQDDLALPFLKVLGQLSPEVNTRHAKHIKEAAPGMILNTVTNELYDGTKGIQVIPCYYKREFVEWKDRGESMGAPVGIHASNSEVVGSAKRDSANKDRLPNGNYIENTASHFVLLLGENPCTALITMKATQLKTSRKWNTMMMGIKLQGKDGLFTPPTYSHVYKLTTVQQSNDKGTWFGWDVSKIGPVKERTIYDNAKSFSSNISKGNIKAKHGTDPEKSESTPY